MFDLIFVVLILLLASTLRVVVFGNLGLVGTMLRLLVGLIDVCLVLRFG